MFELRGLLKGLRELIYPHTCLACKEKMASPDKEEFICRRCRSEIKMNLPPFCASCGRHLEKGNFNKNICPVCRKNNLHFDRAFSPCVYSGVIKELIHEFKYKNKDYLGKPLAAIINTFIREYSLPLDYLDFVIPVPLHKSRLRQREFNQAHLLGEGISGEFNKELLADVLIRRRPTKAQAELKTSERFANVKDSFLVADPQKIKKRNLLLVDDVLTTGATSSAAALALKEAGANIVFVTTLAN